MDVAKLKGVLAGRDSCDQLQHFSVATPPPQYGQGAAASASTVQAAHFVTEVEKLPAVVFVYVNVVLHLFLSSLGCGRQHTRCTPSVGGWQFLFYSNVVVRVHSDVMVRVALWRCGVRAHTHTLCYFVLQWGRKDKAHTTPNAVVNTLSFAH